MDEDLRIISTTEEIKAFSDPFRLSIINVYREQKQPLTVKKCADLLGVFPAKVLYHVKKLLEINVLELDHIEIINGINAKYYKLPKTRFHIQIQEGTEDVVKQNLEYINNIMMSQVEQFKLDFITMTQTAVSRQMNDTHETGWFSSNNVYLNKEEYDELGKIVVEYVKSHNTKEPGKNKYAMMFGIAHKFED